MYRRKAMMPTSGKSSVFRVNLNFIETIRVYTGTLTAKGLKAQLYILLISKQIFMQYQNLSVLKTKFLVGLI